MTNKPRIMLNPSNQFGNAIYDKTGRMIYNEALVMYDIASKVHEYLKSDGRVEVFLSRKFRYSKSTLREETDLAKSLQCDILVALHSDADPNGGEGGGTWTFYADESYGKRLAECVQLPLLKAIRSFYPGVKYNGIRTHWNRLWVLHEAGCPACLSEILFHSNPIEREMLKNPAYQSIMAEGIASGILKYFNF